MSAFIIVWLIAEYFMRKQPLLPRMVKAAAWGFAFLLMASFGGALQAQAPAGMYLFNTAIWCSVFAALIIATRLGWAKFRKKPVT